MLNELKKFSSQLYVKILILIVILASVVVSIASIKSFSEMDNKNELKGKAAINLIEKRYDDSKGPLKIDKLNEVLKYYKSMPDSDESYVKTDSKYPGIFSLLKSAYTTGDTVERNALRKVNNANDFYEKNIEIISNKLKESESNYESWEKDIILEKAKNIDKPFIIDFCDQWVKMYPALMICFIIIAISSIVVGSNLFSYEKDKKMDMLLVPLGNKTLKKVARNKIAALLVFLTVEFIVSVSIISMIVFFSAGISGWSSQIQIKYLTSIYHLTFGEAYLLSIFTGWISIMAIGTFVSILNAFTQKSYITLVLGFIITFIPMIIVRLNVFPIVITKFFAIQPINGFMIIKNLLSLQVFKLLLVNTLTIPSIIINSAIIVGLCILIAPYLFSIKIKNN